MYGDRIAIIDEPDQPAESWGSITYTEMARRARAQAAGLDQGLSIVPASVAKGLELDDVIVVEPTDIVAEDPQGLRLLYVTLTRSTRSLSVVHKLPLPDAMR